MALLQGNSVLLACCALGLALVLSAQIGVFAVVCPDPGLVSFKREAAKISTAEPNARVLGATLALCRKFCAQNQLQDGSEIDCSTFIYNKAKRECQLFTDPLAPGSLADGVGSAVHRKECGAVVIASDALGMEGQQQAVTETTTTTPMVGDAASAHGLAMPEDQTAAQSEGWSTWGDWGECFFSGSQIRTRHCATNAECNGPGLEERKCHNSFAPDAVMKDERDVATTAKFQISTHTVFPTGAFTMTVQPPSTAATAAPATTAGAATTASTIATTKAVPATTKAATVSATPTPPTTTKPSLPVAPTTTTKASPATAAPTTKPIPPAATTTPLPPTTTKPMATKQPEDNAPGAPSSSESGNISPSSPSSGGSGTGGGGSAAGGPGGMGGSSSGAGAGGAAGTGGAGMGGAGAVPGSYDPRAAGQALVGAGFDACRLAQNYIECLRNEHLKQAGLDVSQN